MNRSALKTYAPKARLDFIRAVTDRAAYFGLTPNHTEPMQETGDVVIIGGRAFPKVVAQQRRSLEARIQRQGFDQVMEAMAYTWFNRFVALRYMELHGYLEHGYRVVSPSPSGRGDRGEGATPEIVEHAEHVTLPGLDAQQVINLKLDGTKEAELYRLLLVAQCNALHQAMPFLFEKIADETELLLPDNLLHSDSVIRKLVNEVEEANWQQVEIIGWLYQFYISDKKDEVMDRKQAVPKEDIPAVTQLFTPHWIVRYLVENSLGHLWLLNRPDSKLRDHMPYYVEGEKEEQFLAIQSPEEIKLLDPAVGSGHILVYAFDLLCRIYEEVGYPARDIPRLILENNLFGVDIDDRAAQLAAFALTMKALEKDSRYLRRDNAALPQVIGLHDVRWEAKELQNYVDALALDDLFQQPTLKLLHQFEEAKNFGSLIQPCLDEQAIANARRAIEAKDLGGQLFLRETHLKVLRVLKQAEALIQRYHVVVANPPYMGSGGINGKLKTFLEAHFPNSRSDLSAVFIERTLGLAFANGFSSMVTMHSWMFLGSFEKMRDRILRDTRIVTLAHLGIGAFTSLNSKVVQTVAFNLQPGVRQRSNRPICFRLLEGSEEEKNTALQNKQNSFSTLSQGDFASLPGSLIAYWLSPRIRTLLAGETLATLGDTKRGLQPGDVAAMVRTWWECSSNRTELCAETRHQALQSKRRWFKFDNGGPFRKWFGNNTNVVDWENNGRRIKSGQNPIVPSEHLYFQPGFVWSRLTSGFPSFRFHEGGSINGDISPCFFPSKLEPWTLGLLNSICSRHLLAALSPTLTFLVSDVLKLPSCEQPKGVAEVVDDAICLARADWNNFETSWDFRDQPLLRPGLKDATLEASWRNWEALSNDAIRRMQELETENNRLFIAAYGLDGELQPDVPEAQITLFCNPASRYKKKPKKKKRVEDAEEDSSDDSIETGEEALSYSPEERSRFFRADTVGEVLSYAIGCMMGRYSLDKPGLIYAHSRNEGFDPSQYRTFPADPDGIIPITERAWFPDDATERFVEFIAKAWPREHLEKNLKFIADSLGPTRDEHPRDTIRRYLATGFYKDHLSTYKKRPIYWLFSSGKQRAFQCLVYLHRYHEGTLARMRTEYAIPLQGKIAHRIEQSARDITAATSTSHRRKLEKEKETLVKQSTELAAFDEKLRHYADQRIAIDLDDGVKANYGKFGDLLAEVKAVTGGTEE